MRWCLFSNYFENISVCSCLDFIKKRVNETAIKVFK
jgi:hypothetical protein